MKQFVNQMVDVIKSGVVLGGAHTPEDRDGAVLYYYSNEQFRAGNAVNGGPASTDEVITEAELRLRLEAHAHSMGEEELAQDKIEVAKMHANIATREIDVTKEIEDSNSQWCLQQAQPMPTQGMVVMTQQQAYSLLHLMDDAGIDLYADEDEYKDAIDGVRAMYNGLPRHMQKDIDELDVAEIATE